MASTLVEGAGIVLAAALMHQVSRLCVAEPSAAAPLDAHGVHIALRLAVSIVSGLAAGAFGLWNFPVGYLVAGVGVAMVCIVGIR